jgi:hypothetical protein
MRILADATEIHYQIRAEAEALHSAAEHVTEAMQDLMRGEADAVGSLALAYYNLPTNHPARPIVNNLLNELENLYVHH